MTLPLHCNHSDINMEATKKRIFIGNLPCEVSESDLKERFNKFGDVKKVEIKNGNNLAHSACYAFLDLEIKASLLDTCFRSLSKQNWNGHSIKLELAKESFLSRLQRERQQESSKTVQGILPKDECDKDNSNTTKSKVANDKQIPTSNKKRKHSSSGDDKYGPLNEKTDLDSRHIHSDIVSSGTFGKSDNQAFTEKSPKKGLLQKFESFSDVWKDPPTYTSHKRPPVHKAHKQSQKHSDAGDDFEIVPQNEENTLKGDGLTSTLKETSTRNRNFDSEEKRLKSIETKQNSFMQRKQAVALALASVDSNIKTNNKIIFDDGFYEEIAPSKDNKQVDKSNKNSRKGRKGPNLFEQDAPGEEEQEYDFNIRRQFEGRKGQKLLDLQSKYADDKRFTLDERFYESDNNDEDEKGTHTAKEDSINDERTRQIEILQSIVGSNLPFTLEERKGKQVNVDSMVVHYDPTRDDHAKYEIKRDIPRKVVLAPSKGQERKLEEKREKKKQRRELPPVQLPTVSKEKFYKVSESLKESLKTGDAKGFSLLETFGSIEKEESSTNEGAYSFISTTKKKSAHQTSNPFKWDSSDSEDEPDDTPAAVNVTSLTFQQQQQPVQAQGIWRESFFFKANDDRLNEGLKFFGQEEPSTENFTARRREVQQIVRAKVKHNVRISAPIRKNLGGRKQNKFKGRRSRK